MPISELTLHCRSFAKPRGLADHAVKVHIRTVLGNNDEGDRRILPHEDAFDTDFDLVAAWVDTYKVGVCGYTGRKAQRRPTPPLPDLSNLLASRTVRKGKARTEDDDE